MQDDPTIADDLLPACCVRIDIGGVPAGSGFFVAPGIVVTCFHVLRLEGVSSREADPDLTVVSPLRDFRYTVRDLREHSPTEDDDLAVLRVEPADDHPIVLLDTGLRSRDGLHTYGYPEGYEGGAPATVEAEGWMGGKRDRWLKLAHGQLRAGMSGSPVLNLRTGAVCGILKRSADPRQALGGYAVSTSALVELSPKLATLNSRHHLAGPSRWFGLLPIDQQRLIRTQRPGEEQDGTPAVILVLSVDQSAESWDVSATVHRKRDGEWRRDASEGSVKVDLNTVRTLVARLFRDWASREATVRGRVAPGDQIRLLGEILSRALLSGAHTQTFDDLMDDLERGWLEVALHFNDLKDPDFREFVELPWEHMYMPARPPRADVYFARATKLAFVRTLEPDPESPAPRAGRLSMLVISANPPEAADTPGGETGSRYEVATIVHGLRALEPALEVQLVESPGIGGLVQALAARHYDIVHYVGFGRFDVPADRLALEPARLAAPGYVNADDFASCFEDAAPRLVVLQAARAGEEVPADLGTFAPPLLMRGGDGVVASQYPVSGSLTVRFNDAMYAALADGAALEMAVQAARKSIWTSAAETRAFLSPAVFLKRPGGLRLTDRRERASRSRVGVLSSHA